MQSRTHRTSALGLSLLLLAGCAAPPAPPAGVAAGRSFDGVQDIEMRTIGSDPGRQASGRWPANRALLQGFLGVTFFNEVSVEQSGSAPGLDGDAGEVDQLPLIGGGGQWKLGGQKIDFGLEGMLAASMRANAAAFVTSGGGTAVAVDIDVMLLDIYGGPFASVFLGDRTRVYAAAGPLVQFAEWDQSGDMIDDEGSGFGVGGYARAGIEFELASRTYLGVGSRWSKSTIDLDSGLGNLDIDGPQVFVTVSRWY